MEFEQAWSPLKETTKMINFLFPSTFRVKPRRIYILELFLKLKEGEVYERVLKTDYLPLKSNPMKKEIDLPDTLKFKAREEYILKLRILEKSC